MKFRVGDSVVVLSGKDKGKTGKITQVHPKTNKVSVDGINKVTKHRKPNTSATQPAGKYEETRPIDASKVGIANPSKKGSATRIGYKVGTKGKVRIYKSNSKEVS